MSLDDWLAADLDPAPLPSYELAIEGRSLRKLVTYQDRIEDLSYLPPGERLWVSATLGHEGERYPAKLRVRGDLPAHWGRGQHSYRLKLRERLFRRQKELNLLVPWDKHYGVELLQTAIARELGLPYFPGRFVNLRINGRDAGLYYENEHPTREYLERIGLPASSIFTFGANWTYYFGQPHHHIVFELPGSVATPPVESVGQIKQRGTWDRDSPDLARKQLAYVAELYELLTEGDDAAIAARAGLYLDLDNVAKYVALNDFFGAEHGLALNDNVRLYLDPTSGKFSFMPWDTSLRPLEARRAARGATTARLLQPENPVFARLLRAVPGLDARRHEILAQLTERGAHYRSELNRWHAELIALYPDDERLRTQTASLDETLAANLVLLRRHLAERAGRRAPAT